MPDVATLSMSCLTAAGEWLGELELADRKGDTSIRLGAVDTDVSISELAEYDIVLRLASPAVVGFAAPVETSRLANGDQMFGSLSRRAGLGTMRLGLRGPNDLELWRRLIRVRPIKLRDAEEFEQMVADVCTWRTTLALDLRAHSSAKWGLDEANGAVQPEEVLVVLRAAAERHNLIENLQLVERSGLTRLISDDALVRIGQGHADPFLLGRHLHAPGERLRLPPRHPLAKIITSLPGQAPAARRIDDVDTPLNRFAKHVATTFAGRLTSARAHLDPNSTLALWAMREEIALRRIIAGPFFARVGRMGRIDLGSPALQQRRGYRSVLGAHLTMQAGLAIGWPELACAIFAETRDVPSLYEIWGLIMVQAALASKFGVVFGPGHIKLGDGRMRLVRGSFSDADRPIRLSNRDVGIRLWYNRTFAPSAIILSEGFEVHDGSAGTWSKSMKPDYTIALFPADLSPVEAERTRSVRYVHLDAKYKLARPGPILAAGPMERGHAPDDIDKMHAYAASIADSAGAYVLYPGDQTTLHTRSGGNHGVGAIPAAPGRVSSLGPALAAIMEAALANHSSFGV
jgi:hypothetical protein